MNSQNKKKSAYSLHNKIKLLRGGYEYFNSLEELILNANQSIQLQVYIFEEDQTGNHIADLLIAAAERGIAIQVLLDGYASASLSTQFRKKMKEKGINLRFFEPILKSKNFYFGRRLHHKIVVVDGSKALVGGINISDRYNDMPGQTAWLDWAVLIEGEAAYELYKLCNSFYAKKETDKIILDEKKLMNELDLTSSTPIKISRNDWVMNKNEISASYMKMLKNADSSVIMMSSYFIPGNFFIKELIILLI